MAERAIRLLAIVDDRDYLFLLRGLLCAAVPQVQLSLEHAVSPASVLPLLSSSFDLFVFGYRLGDGAAVDVLYEMRRRAIDVPVILLTDHDDEHVPTDAIQASVVSCLPRAKLTETSLRMAVHCALELHRKEKQLCRLQQALRTNEQRYRLLFEANVAGVCRARLDGHIEDCNQAFARMLGYNLPEQLCGLRIQDLYTVPERYAHDMAAVLEKGSLLNCELELACKDRHTVCILANFCLLRDEAGNPIGFEGTSFDLTEVRLLQQQLLQAQKMEAIGRLAGGVSHDFNNLLMVIGSYSELLRDTLTDERQRHQAEQVLKASRRATELTRQLLAFSRKQVLSAQVMDLNGVVREAGKLLPRLIGEDIEVELALDEHLATIKADPTQVQQVILNLAVNARDAMPQGGRLMLETANAFFDRSYTMRHAGVREGAYVMLAVTDTGVGIRPEIMPHIFEPFYTTKERGKGTGLGLSTVYGIVHQSGGHIFVYSEPGRGTTFKIYMPQAAAKEQALPEPALEAEIPRGSETILLVEDEVALSQAVADFLTSSGYRVLPASCADEALKVIHGANGQIDALITDVIMPGEISGPELARRLLKLWPQLPVLYMSGYTESTVPQHGIDHPAAQFLEKPFTFRLLGKRLREILDHQNKTRPLVDTTAILANPALTAVASASRIRARNVRAT